MSIGLLAIVDDILSAALKASAKSTAVVIDDAAVTPQYVQGITPARELPVVGRIALGSLFNKFVIIIPAVLLMVAFAPWILPLLLIAGGSYLSYEGAEKVAGVFGLTHHAADDGPRDEKRLVAGAIRTDLILSTEIMLIALANIDGDLGFWMRVAVLAVIALTMTAAVYGTVALLVKLDDVGLKMQEARAPFTRRTGTGLVNAMPTVFRVISVVGTVAMLWVGGHLVLANATSLGLGALTDLLHGVEHALEPAGPFVAWLGDTALSAVAGLLVGFAIVGAIQVGRRLFRSPKEPVHADHE